MAEIVKIEAPLEANALQVLRQAPGVAATVREPTDVGREVDAVLRFSGTSVHVAIEVKRRANAATAWQLAHYAGTRPDLHLLLIADQTTAEARRILQEHNVAVIDGLGNAHVELPGLLLHLEGHRNPKRAATSTPARLSGKAGVVAQALLLDPEHPWHVSEVAGKARVSTGLAHRVLARLEAEGIMTADGDGPMRTRHVTNPAALIDLLAEEDAQRPVRTLGHILTQSPQQLIERLGNGLGRNGIDYALTGAAGAGLTAPFATAVPVAEVWVPATKAPEDLCEATRAEPVTDGENVVFLQEKGDTRLVFREQVEGLWTANRFRLYVDLLRDPRRGREQAEHLRKEVIGF